jgi:hypothetical protein
VSPPCDTTDGSDSYVGASQEGSRVFFSTTRQLVNSDLDISDDLYLYDATRPAGEQLTQISSGDASDPDQGKNSGLLGMADFSGDGSHAYFVAKGLLTTQPNSAGEVAVVGEPNLYLYERDSEWLNGRTAFIATLSDADLQTWNRTPGEENYSIAVPRFDDDVSDQSKGGDGHIFVFKTRKSLASNSGADADGGEEDLYRYNAQSSDIQRITKSFTGGENDGPFDLRIAAQGSHLGTGPQDAYFGHWVSEDGETIVFDTDEALDPLDSNGSSNSYLWHKGELLALPFAVGANVSMSGKQIGFQTDASLVPEDGDNALDVYVARAEGGFIVPIAPTPCQAEGCQGIPSEQPAINGFTSSAPRPGNPKQAKKPTHKKHKKHKKKPKHKGRAASKGEGRR